MSTIVTRAGKGAPLTNTEMDSNLTNLNTDKFEIGGTYSGGTANTIPYLNGSKVLSSNTGIQFDGSNLGVGVTPSAWNSGWRALQIGAGANFVGRTGVVNQLQLIANGYFNGTNYIYQNTGEATQYFQTGGYHAWGVAASGTAGNAITFTQAMTLDASGNLGIGTTSPNSKLEVKFTSNDYGYFSNSGDFNTGVRLQNTGRSYGIFVDGGSGSSNGLRFYDFTAAAERARIDSSGNWLVARTAVPTFTDTTGYGFAYDKNNQTTFFVSNVSTSVALSYFNATSFTSGTGYFAQFRVNGSTVGNITTNGTTTTYATSSDYRLKENILPMTNALDTVTQLKPVTYTWKANGSEGQGFIAHELQAVVPEAVVGEKDATQIEQYEITPAVPATFDEEGNELTPAVEAVMGEREVPVYQGIDTSFLVATLTAAIQELNAKVDAQAAEISTLKGKA